MTVLLEAKPSAELEDVRPRVEVLFAEARQRGRRRRAIYVILGSFVAITLLVVVAIVVPPLLAPHGTAKGTPGSPAGALGAVTSMVITAESLDLVTANGDVVERLRYTDSPEQFRNVLTSLLGRPVISPNPWPRPSAVLRWTGLGVYVGYWDVSGPPVVHVYATAKSQGRISIKTPTGISVGQNYSQWSNRPFVRARMAMCPEHFVGDTTPAGGVMVFASMDEDTVGGIEAPLSAVPC